MNAGIIVREIGILEIVANIIFNTLALSDYAVQLLKELPDPLYYVFLITQVFIFGIVQLVSPLQQTVGMNLMLLDSFDEISFRNQKGSNVGMQKLSVIEHFFGSSDLLRFALLFNSLLTYSQ